MIAGAVLVVCIVGLSILGAGIFPGFSYAGCALLGLAYVWVSWRQRDELRRSRFASWLPWVGIAVVVLLVVTVLPLPGPLEGLAGHRRILQGERAAQAAATAVELGLRAEMPAVNVSFSRNRAGSWRTIVLLMCGLLAAGLASRLRQEQRERLIDGGIIFMTLFAVAGFMSQWVVPQGKHLWWVFPIIDGSPVGPFLNRNHFASFVALMCPLALGRSLDAFGTYRMAAAGWRLAAFLLMTVAVMASLSRGVFLAYFVALAVFGFLYLRRTYQTSVLALLGVVVAIIIGGILLMPSDTVSERLGTLLRLPDTGSAVVRSTSWRNSLAMWSDYPLLGVGPEGFRAVFGIYKSQTMRHMFYYAENEYVQLLTDLGLAGVVVALVAVGLTLLYGWRRRHLLLYERGTLVGLLAGVSLAAAHMVVDFAPRILVYMILLGVLVGLLLPAPEVLEETATEREDEAAPARGLAGVVAGGLALVVLIGCMGLHGMSIYRLDNRMMLREPEATDFVQALVWAPTHSQVWYGLGREALALETLPGTQFAEACISEAIRYGPSDYRLWQDVAELRRELHDGRGASAAMERAVELRPRLGR